MNNNQKSTLQYSELYKNTLENVVQGNIDRNIMNMALIHSLGDEDKAQAIYIMFIVNGYWPEVKIKPISK